MHKLKLALSSLLMAFTFTAGTVALASPVAAQTTPEQAACQGSGGSWSGGKCTNGTRTLPGTLKNIGNILIFITGAVSVVMIIIGGVRYTISGGDQGAVNSAKNTIMYAVVGIVVSVMAYAIVNFVLSNI